MKLIGLLVVASAAHLILSSPDGPKYETYNLDFLKNSTQKKISKKTVRILPTDENDSNSNDDFDPELMCLAKNIFFEARNQSKKGMIAVGQVTLNRKKHSQFKDSICGIVYQKGYVKKGKTFVLSKKHCQFSWTCEDHSILESVIDIHSYLKNLSENERFERIKKIVSHHGFKGKAAEIKTRNVMINIKKFDEAEEIAVNLMNGEYSDPTKGSTFYHATYVNPSWSKRLKRITKIGDHIFYREKA